VTPATVLAPGTSLALWLREDSFMAHADKYQNQAGKQSADRGHSSRLESSQARREKASKQADAGEAPEQSGTLREAVNPKLKTSDPAEGRRS
jgi:hypothetical protein